MSSTKWWAVFAGIVTFEIFLLAKLLLTTQVSGGLLFAVIVVTFLLILTLRIEDLNKLSVGKDKFEAELVSKITRKVESRVERVGSEIKEKVQGVE